MRKDFYSKKKVFVTGGAGFIGHHLVNALIRRGAYVTVGDDLSTGSLKVLLKVFSSHSLACEKISWDYQIEGGHGFIKVNFGNYDDALSALANHEIVFHLAATIGGRGFIQSHPADCCVNFAINSNVIKACYKAGVGRVQFVSSACVYPLKLQNKYDSRYLLKETDAFSDNWGNADCEYGWTKLMGEMTLQAYHRQYGLKGSITRYVTVYGPGENESHAIIALIGRALERQDPYVVWGSGRQDRDFTYVDDIVEGSLLACEHMSDTSAVNLGTSQRHTIGSVVAMIFDVVGWRPKKIIFDKSKPEGVKTRCLDIAKAKKLIHFAPRYSLREGLAKTIAWMEKTPRS